MRGVANGRLLFITRKWIPAVGGMETYSVKLTEELSKNTQVEVLSLPGRISGMSPHWWSIIYFGLRSAINLLVRKPADITHFGDLSLWPLALFASIRSRSTRLVISVHGTDVSYPLRGGLKGKAYGWYLHAGQRLLPSMLVIANSSATRDALEEYGFKGIRIIKLATDIVGRLPKRKPENHILFAGRMVKRKGLSWFVDNVLPLVDPSIRLKVAGTVWDLEEGKSLMNERVDYIGTLNQEELVSAYSTAMCVVIPNVAMKNGEFEGFGLVAVEAAAAGGVVLASRHSGLLDAVIDSYTGFHVTPGRACEWAEAISGIANWTDTRRMEFLHTSMYEVSSQYSWKRVAIETLEAYTNQSTL